MHLPYVSTVFRVTGRESGRGYIQGSFRELEGYELAAAMDAVFEAAGRLAIAGEGLVVEVFNPDFVDEADRWRR